jgi:hypothetical protein
VARNAASFPGDDALMLNEMKHLGRLNAVAHIFLIYLLLASAKRYWGIISMCLGRRQSLKHRRSGSVQRIISIYGIFPDMDSANRMRIFRSAEEVSHPQDTQAKSTS